jgi:hypothetical protein
MTAPVTTMELCCTSFSFIVERPLCRKTKGWFVSGGDGGRFALCALAHSLTALESLRLKSMTVNQFCGMHVGFQFISIF